MTFNPFRLYRRWRRLQREARDEAAWLKRRHGSAAREALEAKLGDPALTRWGRRVLTRARELL